MVQISSKIETGNCASCWDSGGSEICYGRSSCEFLEDSKQSLLLHRNRPPKLVRPFHHCLPSFAPALSRASVASVWALHLRHRAGEDSPSLSRTIAEMSAVSRRSVERFYQANFLSMRGAICRLGYGLSNNFFLHIKRPTPGAS